MKESDLQLLDRLTKEVDTYGVRTILEALTSIASENEIHLGNNYDVESIAGFDQQEWARVIVILETAERAVARLDMDDIPY